VTAVGFSPCCTAARSPPVGSDQWLSYHDGGTARVPWAQRSPTVTSCARSGSYYMALTGRAHCPGRWVSPRQRCASGLSLVHAYHRTDATSLLVTSSANGPTAAPNWTRCSRPVTPCRRWHAAGPIIGPANPGNVELLREDIYLIHFLLLIIPRSKIGTHADRTDEVSLPPSQSLSALWSRPSTWWKIWCS